MKKQTQSGFGLVPVLLILILLAVVGFTGYYVWNTQNNKKQDNTVSVAGATKPTVPPAATSTPSPTPAVDNQKYMVIKEWGVKIPLEDGVSDLGYKINNSSAFLNTDKFASYSKDVCPDAFESPYLGGVTRSNDLNKLYVTPALKAQNKAIKIGSYYYLYYTPTQMFCQHNPVNQPQIDYFTKTQPIVENSTSRIISE